MFFNQSDGDLQLLKSGQASLSERQENLASDVANLKMLAEQWHTPLLEQIRSEGGYGAGDVACGVDIRTFGAANTFPPPPLVEQLCERKAMVDQIRKAFGQSSLVALRGESGTGKTQLARLVVDDHDGPTSWLRFRGLDVSQAGLRLVASLRALYGMPVAPASGHAIETLCGDIPEGTLIVLDDLPKFDAEDEFGVRLVLLAQQVTGRGVHLLSTSPYVLDDDVIDVLGERAERIECPLFSVDDVAELLLAHGAPRGLTQQGPLNVLHTLTHGHPVLVVAAIRFLQQQHWKYTADEVDGLLSGEYANRIGASTLNRLLATVTDEQTRNLLYRLKIVLSEFDGEDLAAVASVKPAIERASERLHAVTGLWVQREGDDRYTLSPLLRTIPEGNLDTSTKREVHLALGTRILQRGKIDLWDAVRAITHFRAGGQHNYAAWLFLRGLDAILESGESGDGMMLAIMWGSTPLPTDVRLGLQVIVRAHQIEVRSRLGLNTDFVFEDLKQLVERLPDAESWALMSVVSVAHGTISKLDPVFARTVVFRVVESRTKWRTPDGSRYRPPAPEGHVWEALVWLSAEAVHEWEELAGWLNSVGKLSARSRERLFSDEFAADGCILLTNRLWMPEAAKPEDARDWDNVLANLDKLVVASGELDQPYLEACAVRAKVAILAEYQNDLESAVELAEATLAQQQNDPRARFLVRESIARAFVYARDFDRARQWFEQAFVDRAEGSKHVLAFALANASLAFGELDASAGLCYCEDAVEVADTIPGPTADVRVQMLGELGIARWLSGDLPGAFAAYDRVAEELITCDTADPFWKGLYMRFGHACGYLAGLARSAVPPSVNLAGETWTPPERGFFMRDHTAFASLYDDEKSPALFIHLVLFAEGIGNDSGADRWASRGLEAARRRNVPKIAGVFAGVSIAGHVARGEYETALELGMETSRFHAASQFVRERGGDQPLPEFDVDEVLDEAGDSQREAAERYAAMSTILLHAIDLARRAVLEDGDVVQRVERLNICIRRLTENSCCREHWNSIADVLDRVFRQREQPSKLIEFATNQDDWLMHNLGFLGATIHPEISLEHAVSAHLMVFSSAARVVDAVLGAERRIVVPFVCAYWRCAFERERFRFSAPATFSSKLQEAFAMPMAVRTRSTLRVVAGGLGVPVPEYAQRWLTSAT